MSELIKTEIYKILRSKIFYIIIIYMLLMSSIMPLSQLADGAQMTGKNVVASFGGVFSMLAFYITMIYGVTITNEFSAGYIKDLISFGHKRINIFLAKWIVFLLGSIILNIIPIIFMILIATYINGYGVELKFSEFTYLLRAVGMEIWVIIAFASMVTMFAFVTRKFYYMIIILIGINIFSTFILSSQNKILNKIYTYTVFSQNEVVFSNFITFREVIKLLLVCFVTAIISLLSGYFVFKRTEIK